jgi:hypothetical protein
MRPESIKVMNLWRMHFRLKPPLAKEEVEEIEAEAGKAEIILKHEKGRPEQSKQS